MKRDVVIAGAGAAGLCAGVLLAQAGKRVLILEKNDRPGRKLAMTGNGRCNLSNLRMDASFFETSDPEKLNRILHRFDVERTLIFFAHIGVVVRDEDGYLYPVSGEAQSVTDALLHAYSAAGGEMLTHRQIKAVTVTDGSVRVKTAGECFDADAVILATGGLSGPKTTKSTGDGYYIAELAGAKVSARFPALCGLSCADETLPSDTGVRAEACVRLLADGTEIADETGEVQLTKNRISGIPVMQLSSRCARALDEGKSVSLVIDFFPDKTEEEKAQIMEERMALRSETRTVSAFLNGYAHGAVNETVLRRARIAPETVVTEIPEHTLRELLASYTAFPVAVQGVDGYVHAQATAGGVMLTALTDDLELPSAGNVFCIGELVDVTGRCGGYNLQWAWSSAHAVADALSTHR